jgi:hypothetical protein
MSETNPLWPCPLSTLTLDAVSSPPARLNAARPAVSSPSWSPVIDPELTTTEPATNPS